MAPRIDDNVHWFAEHGLYNGLFLLRDEESGTYWDHMTGEAVYGPLVGSTLDVSYLMQSTVVCLRLNTSRREPVRGPYSASPVM